MLMFSKVKTKRCTPWLWITLSLIQFIFLRAASLDRPSFLPTFLPTFLPSFIPSFPKLGHIFPLLKTFQWFLDTFTITSKLSTLAYMVQYDLVPACPSVSHHTLLTLMSLSPWSFENMASSFQSQDWCFLLHLREVLFLDPTHCCSLFRSELKCHLFMDDFPSLCLK